MSTNEETKQIYQGVLKPTAKSSTTLKRYSGLFNKDTIDAPRVNIYENEHYIFI